MGAKTNTMRGVRAYVVGIPKGGGDAQPQQQEQSGTCAYIDIDEDPAKSEDVYRKNFLNNKLYFRMKYNTELSAKYNPDDYYLELSDKINNLTLFIRANRFCSRTYARYEIRWNLEKTMSAFSWRNGWYVGLMDGDDTWDSFLARDEANNMGATTFHYSTFASNLSSQDLEEIYGSEWYTRQDDTWPYGWVCGRGLGNGTWIWECGDVKGQEITSFFRWGQNEPSRLDGCLYVYNDRWYAENCSFVYRAMSIIEWKKQMIVYGTVRINTTSKVTRTISMPHLTPTEKKNGKSESRIRKNNQDSVVTTFLVLSDILSIVTVSPHISITTRTATTIMSFRCREGIDDTTVPMTSMAYYLGGTSMGDGTLSVPTSDVVWMLVGIVMVHALHGSVFVVCVRVLGLFSSDVGVAMKRLQYPRVPFVYQVSLVMPMMSMAAVSGSLEDGHDDSWLGYVILFVLTIGTMVFMHGWCAYHRPPFFRPYTYSELHGFQERSSNNNDAMMSEDDAELSFVNPLPGTSYVTTSNMIRPQNETWDVFLVYFKDSGFWKVDTTYLIISAFFSSYKHVRRHLFNPHVLFWVCLFHGVLTTALSHVHVDPHSPHHQTLCDTMTYVVIVLGYGLGLYMLYAQPTTVPAYSILRGAQYMVLGSLGVLVVMAGGPERRGDTQDQVLEGFWMLVSLLGYVEVLLEFQKKLRKRVYVKTRT
eukprot:PhF_6_TR42993/c0_g1_i3/m.65597